MTHFEPKSRPLRLLHIIASVDPRDGGPIEGILRQHEALGQAVEREALSLDPPDAPFLATLPFPVHAKGRRRRRDNTHSHLLSRLRYSPDFPRWLRDHAGRYDAAVVHGLWNFASVAAATVLPGNNLPYFVFPHGMMDPWFRKTYPVKHLAKQALWLPFEGRLLHHSERVLFTSEEECRLASGEFWGHTYRPEVVGYGTTPPPAITPRQSNAFQLLAHDLGASPYLLFMGRLHPKKGCDLLVEALAQTAPTPDPLHLVIAGPDESLLTNQLRRRAADLRIEGRVHFTGMLSGDAKWGAIRGARALALPSHQENFGIVVAEALACGTPVLISDKVNIWREVAAARAGLVASDTVEGTVDLIMRFLALSNGEIRDMQEAAIALFEREFDLRTNSQRLLSLLRASVHA